MSKNTDTLLIVLLIIFGLWTVIMTKIVVVTTIKVSTLEETVPQTLSLHSKLIGDISVKRGINSKAIDFLLEDNQ